MKFENPKINISMFEMESVATQASKNFEAAKENAKTDVQSVLGTSVQVSEEILAFEF